MIAKRQRQLDRKARALPGDRVDVEDAFEARDVLLHHVHADAAAADVRNHLGGRETRREDQLDQFAIGQAVVGRNQALLDAARAHFFQIDAAAVVRNFDDDLIAFVVGVELNRPDARFALGFAGVRHLEPMIDAVAQQVHERFADFVDDRLVQVGLGARDHQLNLFAARLGNVADQAREAVEHLSDRNHAHFHDRFLNLVGRACEQRRRVGEVFGERRDDAVRRAAVIGRLVAHEAFQRVGDVRDARAVDDEFADEIEQRVETLDVDANGLVQRRSFALGLGFFCAGGSLDGRSRQSQPRLPEWLQWGPAASTAGSDAACYARLAMRRPFRRAPPPLL